MIQFLFGVLVGAGLVILILYLILSNYFGISNAPLPSPDQFVPLQLPPELARFLNARTSNSDLHPEPCLGLSLILHFLFQEHKNTHELRRWIHRKVQLELNDIMTRSAITNVFKDVKIRDLTIGSQVPVVNSIVVERSKMSENGEGFEELSFLVEVDYKGGFRLAVDADVQFLGTAQVSFHLNHLSGKIRVMLTRHPYALWAFSFAEMPNIDFKVDSQLQGRNLSHIEPLINAQVRRALMRKHVWPNYKIRNRPLFPNPLLQPSPQFSSYNHIEISGHGLEVTILQSTRLNTKLAKGDQTEVYCTASLDQRPFMHNSQAGSSHCVTLHIAVKPFVGDFGLSFTKGTGELGQRVVKVLNVSPESPSERYGFKEGDVLLAINNQPVRNERQVIKLCTGLSTEILFLVERNLEHFITDSEGDDVLITTAEDPHEEFVCIGSKQPTREPAIKRSVSDIQIKPLVPETTTPTSLSKDFIEKINELSADIPRKDSPISQYSTSLPTEPHLFEVYQVRDLGDSPKKPETKAPARHGSDRIPKVSVQQPSVDIRRTMSESRLDSLALTPDDDENQRSSSEMGHFPLGDTESRSSSPPPESVSDDKEAPHRSRREKINAKVMEMSSKFNASAAKVGELWRGRRKSGSPSTGADVEFATEASEVVEGESPLQKKTNISRSPSFKDSKRRLFRHRKSPTPSSRSHGNALRSPERPKVFSRSTKAVELDSNVLWGQSLHFSLDKKETRYLNITVQARTPIPKDNVSQISHSDFDNLRPTLLGSVSIYVPQLVADCQLTLSNCHREVFALRPPNMTSFNLESFGEISKHAGFDPRLCYGDITIGFRHFPLGLPDSLLQSDNDSINDEENEVTEDVAPLVITDALQSSNEGYGHQWVPVSLKFAAVICTVCQAKIWLKYGSRCKKCNFVCHTKCTAKANKTKECSKHIDDDGVFEVLDGSELRRENTASTSSNFTGPPSPSFTDDTTSIQSVFTEGSQDSGTRRRRLANKISSGLKLMGLRGSKVKDKSSSLSSNEGGNPSPSSNLLMVKNILEPQLLQLLDGSPSLYQLSFEPENSFNQNVIESIKRFGAQVFHDIEDQGTRKNLIEAQMDIIKAESDRAQVISRKMDNKKSDEYNAVDLRLQALGVVMHYYCAALQDVESKKEHEELIKEPNDPIAVEPTLPDIAE